MKKNLFKYMLRNYILIFLLIACIIFGFLYAMVISKIEIKECSDKMLVQKIVESLNEKDNSKIMILKVFYYNLPETKYFLCGYVIEKTLENNLKNKFVVFSDKNINFIFIGDIIDIKNRKIVGYDELIQNNCNVQGNTSIVDSNIDKKCMH